MLLNDREEKKMSVKRGNILLGSMLFLAMFLIPLLSLGGQSSPKSNLNSESHMQPQNSSPPITGGSQFRIKDSSTGKIMTVDDRTFLCGTVASEMSPLAPTEALKAQAVASYTYYSRIRQNERKSPTASLGGADFAADPQNWNIYITKEEMQKRWGNNYDKYSQLINAAANSVSSQVLKYNGQLIDATYFAISSGNTEDAQDVWGSKCPYLISVASPYDVFAGGYETTMTFSEAEMKSKILAINSKANLSNSASDWIGKIDRSNAGGVKTIVIGGQTLTGSQIRTGFGLRSSDFTIFYADGKFTFTVKGYGHGVGMSQTGAEAMAKQGSNYKQILAWYYPTTTLTNI